MSAPEPEKTATTPSSILREVFYKASGLVAAAGLMAGVVTPHVVLGPFDAGVVSGLIGGVGTCAVAALFHRTRFNSLSAAYNHYAVDGKDAKLAALYMVVGAGLPFLGMYGIRL